MERAKCRADFLVACFCVDECRHRTLGILARLAALLSETMDDLLAHVAVTDDGVF